MVSYPITLAEAEAAVFTLLNELTADNLMQPLAVPVNRGWHE